MRAACGLLLAMLALPGCLDGFLGEESVGPRDYLRDSTYTRWVIEMDYVEGERPSDDVLNLLQQRMAALAHKPDGVAVERGDELDATGDVWTAESLRELSRDHRTVDTGGSTVATHVLFLDGSYTDEDALGVTLGHGLVAIFSERVREVCPALAVPPCLYTAEDILRAVVVHEFGHVLGLVNNGVPMQTDHEDEGHPGHSDSPDSVMYWAVETADVLQRLSGGLPTQFDANDRADLREAGGK
ncbi:MAG TPA: hypothetical protein VI796_05540 [Candidatus Thermoplasmatota archaeon]|nr:hypothetical protein [Candidatus Thermoplasmatota archaeon]